MVVKGRFSKRPPKPVVNPPQNTNPFISSISILKKKPNQQRALDLLYEVANIVMPVMKEYNFKVKNLIEFSPTNDSLLGTNLNHGYKISLRLRPPRIDDAFLPMEEIIGTMLHELTHNLIGPHNDKFFAKLDELISKQDEYIRKGINGKNLLGGGFQGKGLKLGDIGNAARTVQDIRDARLKKLNKGFTTGVYKLGGGDGKKPGDLKELLRKAAIKRYEDNKFCHNEEGVPSGTEDELITIASESESESEYEGVSHLRDDHDKRKISGSEDPKPAKKVKLHEGEGEGEGKGEGEGEELIEVIDLTSDNSQ